MAQIQFEVEGRPISWNVMYGGRHWTVRSQMANEWKWRTKAGLLKFRVPKLTLEAPIKIEFEVYVGRSIDCDNIVLKTYIDGLRDWGILKDDSPAYVQEITVRVITKSKREYVKITLHI